MQANSHEIITATDLARNLSAAIDRVRLNRRSLWITKGSQRVAELSPASKVGYPILQLADLLASLPRLDEGAADMASDQTAIRRQAALPENPWGL
jgi:PHD/YefM family antitoxin component YafN of YafNO toxin-antitoxin module